ncbi:MAG: hypothetical protein EOO24_18560 [Comamonadaceae bacterium]|nr:MAG: hypothetical protein EOO24_18560 [Comamonadaceae bacterium]
MNHRFQCRCGTVQGEIAHAQHGVRGTCYCTDCQAYAHVLGDVQRLLDAHGGTGIVAIRSADVRFTAGKEALACSSLSPRGLLRWSASCCNTPIANTPRTWKMPYAGMLEACLDRPDPVDRSWPVVQMRLNTKTAKGSPPPAEGFRGGLRFAGLMARIIRARLAGGYRTTPFFDAQGAPVVPVVVLPKADVEAARRAGGFA